MSSATANPEASGDSTDTEEFMARIAPLRRELSAHCYRMLGSTHEAEDLVQETYVRAWRAQESFEGRSSLRTWMYSIATRVCLTALEKRERRPLPTGLGQPSIPGDTPLVAREEITWLEPWPGVGGEAGADDPARIGETHQNIRLAFIAALQHLPPRQRAVLVLREVLAFSAAESAELLGTTVASVNSALQRARATLDDLRQGGLQSDGAATGPLDARSRDLLERYAAAFERYDVPAIVATLSEDATWEMPPFEGWYRGADQIGLLISTYCPAEGPGDQVLVPTTANGQPAFALYMRGPDGVHRAFQLQVLTLGEERVDAVTVFFDLDLFDVFGLPQELPAR